LSCTPPLLQHAQRSQQPYPPCTCLFDHTESIGNTVTLNATDHKNLQQSVSIPTADYSTVHLHRPVFQLQFGLMKAVAASQDTMQTLTTCNGCICAMASDKVGTAMPHCVLIMLSSITASAKSTNTQGLQTFKCTDIPMITPPGCVCMCVP